MPHTAPTDANLLQAQRALPDEVRQNMILLRFASPIPRPFAGEFLRIHLTPSMFQAAEEAAYRPEVIQPHRLRPQSCPTCGQRMQRVDVTRWRCRDRLCEGSTRTMHAGPIRGVVKIVTTPDCVAHVESTTRPDGTVRRTEHLDKLLLALDRRYDRKVLAAIYRTAGHLCDQMGWRLA